MSLASLLPKPLRAAPDVRPVAKSSTPKAKSNKVPPIGKREGYVPRTDADYGDGGAFPEIHMLQYPLGMGLKTKQGQVISVSTDEAGNVDIAQLVASRGQRKDKVIKATLADMTAREADEKLLEKPDAEAIRKTAEETKMVLLKVASDKAAAVNQVLQAKKKKEASFVRYTPADTSSGSNPSDQKIIRVQEISHDPLQPSRFKHKKLPGGPPSPPAPVMQSPKRKATAEDQANWVIPPCVSGWKQKNGFVIPLDKRLAADGRSLVENKISSKFAGLAEVLMVADNTLREDVEQRQLMMARVAQKKKEAEEEKLLQEALAARRVLAEANKAASRARNDSSDDSDDSDSSEPEAYSAVAARAGEDTEGMREREQLRRERKRELKREMRQEARKVEKRATTGKTNSDISARDADRDVSEKIALGQFAAPTQSMQVDARMFDRDSGMGQGFGADDSYNMYTQPLFKKRADEGMYRPSEASTMTADDVMASIKTNTAKFKPQRGFEGADSRSGDSGGPVTFKADEDDPFGLGSVLQPSSTPTPQPDQSSSSSSSAVPAPEDKNSKSSRKDRKSRSRSPRSRSPRRRSRSRSPRRSRSRSPRRRDHRRSRSPRRSRKSKRSRSPDRRHHRHRSRSRSPDRRRHKKRRH